MTMITGFGIGRGDTIPPTTGAIANGAPFGGFPIPPSGSGPPPTPPLAGYVAWYDASQITGVADAAALASWPDLSGNGHTAVQATVPQQPTYYKTTPAFLVNGKPAVWFNAVASSQMLAAFGLTYADPNTFFIVTANSNSALPSFPSMLDGADATHRDCNLVNVTGDIYGYFNGGTVDSATPIGTTPHCFTMQDAGTALFRVDGVSAGTMIGTSPGNNGLTFGSVFPTFGSGFGTGPICEVIMYNSQLSLANMQLVEAYLIAKWL